MQIKPIQPAKGKALKPLQSNGFGAVFFIMDRSERFQTEFNRGICAGREKFEGDGCSVHFPFIASELSGYFVFSVKLDYRRAECVPGHIAHHKCISLSSDDTRH